MIAEWEVREDIDTWVKMDGKEVKVEKEDWKRFVEKVDKIRECSKDDFMGKYLEW